MLLGYSRGSVGDVTFYRSGGSQRQRARNRQPNNPRTAKQITQRSKFANAVKFFKQINTGFFRFAFEDRKTNESDYNAFMRHNVVNSGYIGAQASKIADWPALGLWQLSAGSLPEIVAPFPQPAGIDAGIAFDLGVTLSNNISTVGDLSTELINGNPSIWRSGDILTYVVYRATNAATLPTVDTEEEHRVYSAYGQFILNESDSASLLDIVATVGTLPFALSADDEGLKVIGNDSDATTIWANDFIGIAVIHSRNSANGLLVSPSTMVYNKRELPLLAMYDSGAYYNAVIADWQASADAILQGAAAAAGGVTVQKVEDGNTGTIFAKGSNGKYTLPLALFNNTDGYVDIHIYSGEALTSADLTVTGSPAAVTWQLTSAGSGAYDISSNNHVAWTAGDITIKIKDVTIILSVTA